VFDHGVSCLRSAAWNNDGSGASGSLREQRNFSEVERALRVSDTRVHVLESACMQTLQQGEASGCWCLGSRTTHVGGVLVWLRRERQVVELVAKGGWKRLGEVFTESSQAAPWLRYVVGAPKRRVAKAKSRRGEHLTRELCV
jgi:hypothetical protein